MPDLTVIEESGNAVSVEAQAACLSIRASYIAR
jgi:hypothetical protein